MEIIIDPLWAVIMVLFGIVMLLAKQVYNFNKKIKHPNVPVEHIPSSWKPDDHGNNVGDPNL